MYPPIIIPPTSTPSTIVQPRLVYRQKGKATSLSGGGGRRGGGGLAAGPSTGSIGDDGDVTMTDAPSPTSTATTNAVNTTADEEESVDALECSVHTLPKPLLREFHHLFQEKYLKAPPKNRSLMAVSPCQVNAHHQYHRMVSATSSDNIIANSDDNGISSSRSRYEEQQQELEVLAIPTNQRAREDLVAVGEEVEYEKDRLLNVFMDFGADLCKRLRDLGYWADYIDPCSGLPMLTPNCNKVYSEVDGMEVLLGYRSHNAGFCKILMHPTWGSAVYPATVFARAPRHVVKRIVEMYPTVDSTTGVVSGRGTTEDGNNGGMMSDVVVGADSAIRNGVLSS